MARTFATYFFLRAIKELVPIKISDHITQNKNYLALKLGYSF